MSSYLEQMGNDLPTAMVCANDEMAFGAIRAIQENGLNVPDDIAIVGFDDIYASQNYNPPLTTIKVPRKQWGTIAAQSLLQMLDNQYDFEPEPILVELISRTSS
jgi:LacI family transcriptional regulator